MGEIAKQKQTGAQPPETRAPKGLQQDLLAATTGQRVDRHAVILVRNALNGNAADVRDARPEQIEASMRLLSNLVATTAEENEALTAENARLKNELEAERAADKKRQAALRAEHRGEYNAYKAVYNKRWRLAARLTAARAAGDIERAARLEQELAELPDPVPVSEQLRRQQAARRRRLP